MKYAIVALLLIVAVLVAASAYVVNETEQVVITQFGKPVGDPVTEPGLHFKMPFIQDLHVFDKRFLAWDGEPNQIPTAEKKFVLVDAYARWQITDPLLFLQRLRDERGAQSRLDDILDGETRNAIASNEIAELVRNTNREAASVEGMDVSAQRMIDIRIGRQKIADAILKEANGRAEGLGIRILDFRFKRINYVENVRKEVYLRMISERQRIADKFRSEGEGEASKIFGEKERELKRIQSEAFKKAEEIRGKADAEATAIYAGAYDKSPESREFYQFLKSMEILERNLDRDTTLILTTASELYKFLNQMK